MSIKSKKPLQDWILTLAAFAIAPVAEQVAGFERSSLTWLLVVVGFFILSQERKPAPVARNA